MQTTNPAMQENHVHKTFLKVRLFPSGDFKAWASMYSMHVYLLLYVSCKVK